MTMMAKREEAAMLEEKERNDELLERSQKSTGLVGMSVCL